MKINTMLKFSKKTKVIETLFLDNEKWMSDGHIFLKLPVELKKTTAAEFAKLAEIEDIEGFSIKDYPDADNQSHYDNKILHPLNYGIVVCGEKVAVFDVNEGVMFINSKYIRIFDGDATHFCYGKKGVPGVFVMAKDEPIGFIPAMTVDGDRIMEFSKVFYEGVKRACNSGFGFAPSQMEL